MQTAKLVAAPKVSIFRTFEATYVSSERRQIVNMSSHYTSNAVSVRSYKDGDDTNLWVYIWQAWRIKNSAYLCVCVCVVARARVQGAQIYE